MRNTSAIEDCRLRPQDRVTNYFLLRLTTEWLPWFDAPFLVGRFLLSSQIPGTGT